MVRSASSGSVSAPPVTTRRLARSWRTPLPSRPAAQRPARSKRPRAAGSGSIRTARQPAANPASVSRAAVRARRVAAHGAAGGVGQSGLPAAPRRTARKRWPTVIALPASRTHSATCSGVRDAEAGEAGADEHQDQPLGALDEPDVAGQADALGPRLDVGGEHAEHQAEQREQDEQPVVARAGEPPDQRAEDRRVGRPVADGVEDGAEHRAAAAGPGQGAVEHVQQHEDGDGDRAPAQPAGADEEDRRRDGAQRAGDR